MKFPKRIKHRGKELASVYGKSKDYDFYRVCWRVNGKRKMKSFQRYSGDDGALVFAEKLVPNLHKGSQTTALNEAQARDALVAFQRLEAFRQQTGRSVSLLAGISAYCEAASKLGDRTLTEAVEGYLTSVATVQRKDITLAVEEFITVEEPRTKAKGEARAQLSAKYAYNRAIILRRFSGTFQNTAVADLRKEHLDTFLHSLGEFSAKSRNHHRAAIRQFLGWCVRKDYLAPTNRLAEADGLRPELSNTSEILTYTPKEFRALLEAAEGPMGALIAIGGFCGLRTAELLRLTWAEVWHIDEHVEVTAGKAKTRQRRLVEMCPSLAQWLEPYRSLTTGTIWGNTESVFQKAMLSLAELAGVPRKDNALRHSFSSYHFALHANENLTAQQSGNSPAMIHQHYKGLATKVEAEKWFAVAPAKADNVVPMAAGTRT